MPTSISSFDFSRMMGASLVENNILGQLSSSFSFSPESTLTHGTGSGKINGIYATTGIIAASSNLDINLVSGLQDFLKNALVFTKIKFLFFQVNNATLNNACLFANAVTNSVIAWSIPVFAQGDFSWIDPLGSGITVTPGSAHLLRITNADASNALNFNLCIGGEI